MSREALERLAVAQALYKELAKVVSTKDPRSIRAQLDEELKADYERDGTDRKRILINGTEVGSLSAKIAKPSKETRFEVTDWEALENWNFSTDDALAYVVRHVVDFAKWHFEQTGEMPDGCELVEMTHPGGQWMGTTLRGCDIEKVGEAAGVRLSSEVVALLEGGA